MECLAFMFFFDALRMYSLIRDCSEIARTPLRFWPHGSVSSRDSKKYQDRS